MQILINKDPVTGIETFSYIPEPIERTAEEIENNNKFMEEIMESTKNHNEIFNKMKDSFWSLNENTFKDTWKISYQKYSDYKQSTLKNNNNSSIEDIEKEFKKQFVKDFIDSLHNKEKKKLLKDSLSEVLQTWSAQLNPQILTLIIWQMNFKEQSLKLLETIPCSFTKEQYDYVCEDFIKDFRRYDDRLPFGLTEKEQILNEERTNFLQIQQQYCTFKKLNDKLVYKNIKTKHVKL